MKKLRDSIEQKLASIKNYAGELKERLFNKAESSEGREVEEPIKSEDVKLVLDDKRTDSLEEEISNKRMKSEGGSRGSEK